MPRLARLPGQTRRESPVLHVSGAFAPQASTAPWSFSSSAGVTRGRRLQRPLDPRRVSWKRVAGKRHSQVVSTAAHRPPSHCTLRRASTRPRRAAIASPSSLPPSTQRLRACSSTRLRRTTSRSQYRLAYCLPNWASSRDVENGGRSGSSLSGVLNVEARRVGIVRSSGGGARPGAGSGRREVNKVEREQAEVKRSRSSGRRRASLASGCRALTQ